MRKIAFHYKQKTFTCGPATLRMLIAHDVGDEETHNLSIMCAENRT